MIWINHKVKELAGRMIVLLLLLSFGGMAGYSVLLHNHDLDSDHAHNDCASCQWAQAYKTDKTDRLKITQTPTTHAFKLSHPTIRNPNRSFRILQSRSPHLFINAFSFLIPK